MNKPKCINKFLNLLMVFGVIALLLIQPAVTVQAQDNPTSAPLISSLTWNNLGNGERAILVNGDTISILGTAYKASEKFNLEVSEDIATYYSSTNFAKLGWQQLSTTHNPNGVSSLYFHSGGIFALIEFVGCKGDPSLSCLTVWQSFPTDIVPAQVPQHDLAPQAVGTFNKSSPTNGATNVNTSVILDWAAYSGTDLNHYRYCFDKTNNSTCDIAGNWTSVWSGTSIDISSLENNTTYYWQMQAVLNDTTKVDADAGIWWSFTTKAASLPPGAFSKSFPTNGATGQSTTPTLVWQASSNATAYAYCIDTTNNNICDNNWVSTGANRYVTLLSGIGANITYYWQIRATNDYGLVYGDSGTWTSFTTSAGPVNDTIDSASVISIPSENILSTVSATVDGDTTNACSPGLGFSSVWYKYIATSNRKIYLDTFNSSYDSFIAIWTRNVNGTLNAVTCNDNSSGFTQSSINLPVSNGTTYYIQVAQKNLSTTPTAVPGGSLHFNVKTFGDVAANSGFWKYIEGIYANGITSGCSVSPDLLYCPLSNVSRAQMAVFLLRSIHGSSYTPPSVGLSTGFADVPVNYWAAAWIKQLVAEGITSGCGGGLYCPDYPVTRAQMAVFLLRGEHGSAYVPPIVGASTGFTDVPISYWAAAWIKQLAVEGITSGCGGGLYCPESNLTREQMAVLLSKTFGIPLLP